MKTFRTPITATVNVTAMSNPDFLSPADLPTWHNSWLGGQWQRPWWLLASSWWHTLRFPNSLKHCSSMWHSPFGDETSSKQVSSYFLPNLHTHTWSLHIRSLSQCDCSLQEVSSTVGSQTLNCLLRYCFFSLIIANLLAECRPRRMSKLQIRRRKFALRKFSLRVLIFETKDSSLNGARTSCELWVFVTCIESEVESAFNWDLIPFTCWLIKYD